MTDDHPKLVSGSASAPSDKRSDVPPIESRVAAGGALVVAVATLVVLIVFTARNLPYVLASVLAGALGISALWIAATNRRYRWWAAGSALLLVGAAVASLVAVGRGAVRDRGCDCWHRASLLRLGLWRFVGRSVGPSRGGGMTCSPPDTASFS